MRSALPLLILAACAGPERPAEDVVYRDGSDGGATTGERGTVKITEILWSGTVHADGTRDRSDVFVEIRNESSKPINVSGWRLEIHGGREHGWKLPVTDKALQVGDVLIVAAKSTGCFPDADLVMPELSFPDGDPFSLTLRDADEHLIEGVGSVEQAPFAGGYDLVRSRSMERVHLMFGGDGDRDPSWHFYAGEPCLPGVVTDAEDPSTLRCFEQHPNNDRVAPECRVYTLASPGRPNSPDYSGAYASGSFE